MKKGDLNLNKNYRLRQTAVILISKFVGIEILISLIHFFVNYIIFNPEEFSSPLFFWILRGVESVVLISVFLKWYSVYYIISTDAISRHKGLLFKRVETYDLKSIRSLQVRQGIMGKLFNYGTISMISPLLEGDVTLKNINRPLKHAQTIESQRLKLIEDVDLQNITPVI